MTKKLYCYVCDNQKCRKVIPFNSPELNVVNGKKRKLHFCNLDCALDIRLREKGSKNNYD